MKQINLAIFFSILTLQLAAQNSFIITPSAQVTATGASQITLQNISLVNNGTFNAGTGNVSITGNTLATIAGSSSTTFYDLKINNAGGVNLSQNIGVNNQLDISGTINAKNNAIAMSSTATIVNENELNRLTDDATNTGNVFTTRNFTTPLNNVNPANIGVEFVTAPALGNTTIKRYATAFIKNGSSAGLINRYYDIAPTNNTALNASVRFYYFDAELNGVDENLAVLWKSINNGISWGAIVPDSRNTTTNYLQKNNVPDFSLWTIGATGSVLPIIVSSFNNACKENGANLIWTTATETNSDKFIIEKSIDGAAWKPIGTINANGIASNYTFTDAEAGLAYYRLKQTDKSGNFTYSKILKSECVVKSFTLMLYPNPATDYTNLTFTSEKNYTTNIQLFSANGQLVKTVKTAIQKGANNIKINLLGLASGNYILKINDENIKLSKPFIKN